MTAFHLNNDTACCLFWVFLDKYLAPFDGCISLLTVWQTALEDRVKCLNDIRKRCTEKSGDVYLVRKLTCKRAFFILSSIQRLLYTETVLLEEELGVKTERSMSGLGQIQCGEHELRNIASFSDDSDHTLQKRILSYPVASCFKSHSVRELGKTSDYVVDSDYTLLGQGKRECVHTHIHGYGGRENNLECTWIFTACEVFGNGTMVQSFSWSGCDRANKGNTGHQFFWLSSK